MLQRQISVVISLPMIVQLGKTLLLLKRSADYALGVVYHVKQQHFNPHPTSRPGATSWMILYPLIPLCFNPHLTSRPGATSSSHWLSKLKSGFQPSPNLKAGCNAARLDQVEQDHKVSTLTQPQGRVQLTHAGSCCYFSEFQPSPNLKAGCNPAQVTMSEPDTLQWHLERGPYSLESSWDQQRSRAFLTRM